MPKVLEMSFSTEIGRTRTIRVADVKDSVTGSEVAACMDGILEANIFAGVGGELTGKIKAQVVTTSIDELVLN